MSCFQSKLVFSTESVPSVRPVLNSLHANKLEPYRSTDLSKGIYVDEGDSLGRVWYHIPNLGPKFCDAVRKYSVVANFREAHVIARKKSKESECMWVGIVGDPAEYTTGSKRHVIEFMLRNPGMSMESGSSRRQQSRARATKLINPLKKRRRKKRRGTSLSIRIDMSQSRKGHIPEAESVNQLSGTDILSSDLGNASESESNDSSSQMSTTPSLLSVERQKSGNYGFSVREPLVSPQPISATVQGSSVDMNLKLHALPQPTGTLNGSLNINDWLDALNSDPNTFALRDPLLASPEAGKSFSLNKSPVQPPSPEVRVFRKYSVEDLNLLLHNSEFNDI
jgi:hypothetical protein